MICHEIAHQWFGNLVTAASWPDLLVNEGLATLAEYGCMAAVLPSQVGLLGAAVLMRGMYGAPAGVSPGVHEGEPGRGGGEAVFRLRQPAKVLSSARLAPAGLSRLLPSCAAGSV